MSNELPLGKYKWNEFPKLKTADDLNNYIKYTDTKKISNETDYLRAYKHKTFFHYSSLSSIDKILGSKSFLLFVLGSSNDPKEQEEKEKEEEDTTNKDKKFIICFSTGIHENIPLWYLYGGVDGHGGCISFNANTLHNIIENGEYFLIEIDDNKSPVSSQQSIKLSKEKIKITLQDIVYCEESEHKETTLKYNNHTNNNFPNEEFKKFKQDNQNFIKSLCWFYEKETRLLVEIYDDDIVQKMRGKSWAVQLSFEKVKKITNKINLTLAPKAAEEKKDPHKISEANYAAISPYANIKEFMIDSSNLKNSELDGMVKFELCKNCNKNITDIKQSS